MTSAEIAARKAALAQFRASFNDFAAAYNAALQSMQPFAAEYQPMMVALDVMAQEVNKASPVVTAAIQQTDALVQDDPARPPSPDGTTAATVVDESGALWSLGPNRETLRDGVHISGGYATEGLYAKADGLIFARSAVWSKFTGEGWALATEQEIEMLRRSNPINRPTIPTPVPDEGEPDQLPSDPSGLTATALSPIEVSLSWTRNSSNELGFKIERKTGEGAYTEIATISAGVTNYLDTGRAAVTEYTYRALAFNDAGPSGYSNERSVTTPANQLPFAPSLLTAVADVALPQISLAWVDNSNNESGFKIERRSFVSGAWTAWAQAALVAANVTTYLNAGLSASMMYDYRLRSYNPDGDSSYSNAASDTTAALAGAITLRSISTTGSISAASNQLVIPTDVGFLQGDRVIVAVTPAMVRGTKGPDGTWPALSYANAVARDADTTQAQYTFAWTEDDGIVWVWNHPNIAPNAWGDTYGFLGRYYFIKAIPKALHANVTAVSGNGLTLTLDKNAVVSVTSADVYLDVAPVLNAITADTGTENTTPTLVQLPAGDFAIGDVVQIGFKTNWTFAGAGVASTKLFSPKGSPSARLWAAYSPGTVIKDLTLQGNFGDNRYGMSWWGEGFVFNDRLWPPLVTETNVPQGGAFPRAISILASPNSVIQDVKVIDAFQHAVGITGSNNSWAYRVENIQNSSMREYANWQMQVADSEGGGLVDCSIWCATQVPGFESFKSKNTSFIRPVGTNTIFALNVAWGFLIEDAKLRFTALNRQYDGIGVELPVSTPIITINTNISGNNPGGIAEDAFLALGGIVRNAEIIQEGYADTANNIYRGIVIGPRNANIRIEGGVYIAPDFLPGSGSVGPLGLQSEGQNSFTDGYKVFGNSAWNVTGGNGYASIFVSESGGTGTVQNSVGDPIWQSGGGGGNQTPAQYGPPPTWVPSPTTAPEPDPGEPNPPDVELPSPEGTRGIRVVDSDGAVWTLSEDGKTVRHGVWVGGGQYVTEYLYSNNTVLAYSTPLWYRWNGSAWILHDNIPPEPPAEAMFYVSPSGSDANPGTISQPFLTIQKARDVVRTQSMVSDITVMLRGGTYPITATAAFDESDSGRNGFHVIYRNYPWERPVFTGGQAIIGWTDIGGGIWSAAAGGKVFRQLIVNGVRGRIARSTAVGTYNTVQDWIGPQWDGTADETRQLKVAASEVGSWANLNQVEMCVHSEWIHQVLKIGSIDISGASAYITPLHPQRSHRTMDILRKANWCPYFFQNALEFLDTPGEFYLNRSTNTVYYMPRAGEDMGTASVIVPQLQRLLQVQGDIANYVSNIKFIGLTFEASTWDVPSTDSFSALQADVFASDVPVAYVSPWNTADVIPGAVHVKYARNVRVERNVFRNLGGLGIVLHSGTEANFVNGNLFRDLAAGAIAVDHLLERVSLDARHLNRGDQITNNYVTRIGLDYHSSVGIFAGYISGTVIDHNEIYEVPYTGISCGWFATTTEIPTQLHDNLVRYNRIHRSVYDMSDGGGIYTVANQQGTQIVGNYIYDMERGAGATEYWIGCIYLDLYSASMYVADNVLEDLREGVRTFNYYDGPEPVATGHPINTLNNNEGSNASTKANSGLQAGYQGAELEAGFA